ncbi:hypothetical protein GCK72_011160 [Caenorhabditis remanei]|uniref:Integrase zinc-binding domain-containing protein n=1 Tax=Caenorhabditis remanei TaxID=31234 RepID=A0A6A5H7Q0_CAERE|nr:hypothetical protein GCK72_011160 [Caenorhabditis remanei]KAF1762896.1 hypothetical protein GCK72_011160 [Caenorhabditis remanei]
MDRHENRQRRTTSKDTKYGKKLIKKIHGDLQEGAHMGRDKTYHKVKETVCARFGVPKINFVTMAQLLLKMC